LRSFLKREKFKSYKPTIQKTNDFTFLVSPKTVQMPKENRESIAIWQRQSGNRIR